MAFPSIDDQRVAILDLLQQPFHARDGGDAATAGDDRRVAGLTARLSHDGGDLKIPQRDDLTGQQLIGRNHQWSFDRLFRPYSRHRTNGR